MYILFALCDVDVTNVSCDTLGIFETEQLAFEAIYKYLADTECNDYKVFENYIEARYEDKTVTFKTAKYTLNTLIKDTAFFTDDEIKDIQTDFETGF